MLIKRFLIIFFLIFAIFSLTVCNNSESDKEKEEITKNNDGTENEKPNNNLNNDEKESYKIGLLVSGGGLGDGSFNDMQYNGLIEISKEYSTKVDITYIEPKGFSQEANVEALQTLINERKCDLIITAGWERIEPIDIVSKQYPDVDFVLLDDYAIPKDNVSSVIFAQNEGSFVVGALASMMTKTNKVGFIGGVNLDVIEDFRIGFEEGIKYINPDVELITDYCSLVENDDWSGWENPKKAKEIADRMYEKDNADIIYAVAGLSGNGVIESAKNNNKYVIGVDSEQDHMAPGFILTSMMKRLDIAVYDICEKYINGNFEGKRDYIYGYKDGGVSITEMKYTKHLIPEEVLEKVKEIENKISSGGIKVTRYLKRN